MSQERRGGVSEAVSATPPPGRVTGLLRAWGRGDEQAGNDLLPVVYQQLRRQAAAYLRGERPDHTLQPTALVNEAYLRLIGQRRVAWQNRLQFFALASRMMRRVLVDHARAHQAAKRPPATLRLPVDDRIGAVEPHVCDLVLLDEALRDLAELDARQSRIIELCYFGGLSEHEVGKVLSISRSTVAREWRSARAWLYRRMTSRP